MKQLLLLSFAIVCFTSNLFANDSSDYPISVAIMDESISLPGTWFLRYSFNPAIMISSERILKEKNNHDWHLNATIGYYHHKEWLSGILLFPEIGYRQYIKKRWAVYSRFGLGYTHRFALKPIYTYQDGTWAEANELGSPAVMASLSLGVSYKVKDEEKSPEIFINTLGSVEYPLSIFTSLHHFNGVGVKFYPFKNK